MEEEKTKGHLTCQFRDGIAEAKEHARKYIDHLQNEFKDHVETVEKIAETKIITKQIENTLSSLSTVRYGKRRDKLGRNLTILRGDLARWKTATEEDRVYGEYFS